MGNRASICLFSPHTLLPLYIFQPSHHVFLHLVCYSEEVHSRYGSLCVLVCDGMCMCVYAFMGTMNKVSDLQSVDSTGTVKRL